MFGFLKKTKAPDRTAQMAKRADLRVGIPRVLNIWNTHQFWTGFLVALGIKPEHIVFSSETSEQQFKEFGKGRTTVDCCYPVKCVSGHYGELVHKRRIQVLLTPMIYTLPSYLRGHVHDTLSCPRVMAGPENIKAGFLKEKDVFQESAITYVSPLVSLGEPHLVPKQLYESLKEPLDLDMEETKRAVEKGYSVLNEFNHKMRTKSREILAWCAQENKPCILVLARPYHMDSGIGHEIEVDLQANGYPILWAHYLPVDEDLMEWLFGQEIESGIIRSPFDISDVWASSYSSNTNPPTLLPNRSWSVAALSTSNLAISIPQNPEGQSRSGWRPFTTTSSNPTWASLSASSSGCRSRVPSLIELLSSRFRLTRDALPSYEDGDARRRASSNGPSRP